MTDPKPALTMREIREALGHIEPGDPEAAAFFADARITLTSAPPKPAPGADRTVGGPTTDLHFAMARFVALIEAHHHQPVAASKGRRLAWQAVYGDLWHPDRVGEVPPDRRPVLWALVRRINDAAFPDGALARSVTADQVRAAIRALTP